MADPVRTAKQMPALRAGATILADHHGDAGAAGVAGEAALALLRTARSHTPRRGSAVTATTTMD